MSRYIPKAITYKNQPAPVYFPNRFNKFLLIIYENVLTYVEKRAINKLPIPQLDARVAY